MDNEKRAEKKSLPLSERIYRTPMVYVVIYSALSALVLSLVTVILMWVLGFGYTSSYLTDGTEVRFFGMMRDGSPTFGWINDSEGNRGFVMGNSISYSDGSRYDGPLYGFYYQGDGVYTDKDGNVYRGYFDMGGLTGSVHVDYADGGSFDGEYLYGERNGYGVERHPTESETEWGYSGNYSGGKENGYGEYTYPDGSTYKGNFKDGMRHGQGVYRFTGGDSYSGEFYNNVIHGVGSYFFSSGRVFSGEFVRGIPVLG